MNNRQVAHAWAGQQKQSARGSHFYFNGPSIFSYGAHFEIARILEKPFGGRDVVLFTTRGYSPSTQRHKSYARAAISGRHVFHVPRVDIGNYVSGNSTAHFENLTHYLTSAKEAHEKARKAIGRGKLYGREEVGYIQEAAAYLDYFKRAAVSAAPAVVKELRALIRKEKAGKLWTAAELEIFETREKRAKEAQEKRDARRKILYARRHEEWRAASMAREIDARITLDAWARGETNALPAYPYDSALETKIRINGDAIETSRGARVTTARAIELWRLLVTGKDNMVVGMDIDGFKVTAWDGENLTIGCHELKRAELARLAAVLGV